MLVDDNREREHRSNISHPMHWDDVYVRGTNASGDWLQYRYLFLEKFNVLEKKVNDVEKTVDDIKISFVQLQTKILVISGISGVISSALIAVIFTALADKFIK